MMWNPFDLLQKGIGVDLLARYNDNMIPVAAVLFKKNKNNQVRNYMWAHIYTKFIIIIKLKQTAAKYTYL